METDNMQIHIQIKKPLFYALCISFILITIISMIYSISTLLVFLEIISPDIYFMSCILLIILLLLANITVEIYRYNNIKPNLDIENPNIENSNYDKTE